MESSGKPGMVHISEKTYSFLEEEYYVQKAEDLEGDECGDDDHNDGKDILTGVAHCGPILARVGPLFWGPNYLSANLYPRYCATNASSSSSMV